MSKTVCIYHSIDLDGQMSAAIVKHWFNKRKKNYVNSKVFKEVDVDFGTLDFIGYNYGQPIPDLSGYDKVIMCDVSFPKEEMIILTGEYKERFIWIDHHISIIKDMDGMKTEGLRDTKYAACELTWFYLIDKVEELPTRENVDFTTTMPEIVRLLGLYDSFRHKGTDEETKVLEFQYGARSVISSYEEAYKWLLLVINDKNRDINPFALKDTHHINVILNKGKTIYQFLCTEAKQTYKNGFEIELGQSSVKLVDLATISNTEPETLKNAVGTFLPYKFICINKERFNPINFGIDYHKDGYDGCACFHYANGMWNFSIYNDNGLVDCSVIAKQYGGGGHAGASGFKLNNEQFNNLISSGRAL